MNRKKENTSELTAEQELQRQTGCDADKTADAPSEELPENVTLSRQEFTEVKEHIEKLQKEKDDTVILAQRLQADFDNFRKRNASVHIDSMDEGMRSLIKDMLPALDNFDRAMDNCPADAAWTEGIKLVQRQLMDVLIKNGLEEIPSDGMFDPTLHDAVMQEEVDGLECGMVAEVLQKGYRVNDRIIRHSMVKVAK
ncbi:MAG: nucleotide exchange factor GrpE [Clostridia bacterium]